MNVITFEALGISSEILKSLNDMGFEKATPVQAETIGPFMAGADLIVQARTGTGKTCAFAIPIMEKIDVMDKRAQALILSPTRELALQTAEVLKSLSKYKPGIRMAVIYGGENIEKQFAALRRNPHIIIATPGRLMDHMQRRTVRINALRMVVLDEADRMLDMGFRNDIKKILSEVQENRQTMLFSATISSEILEIAKRYQSNAQRVEIAPEKSEEAAIRQYYTLAQTGAKNLVLFQILRQKRFALALIFVNTKHRADRLAQQLKRAGWRAGALHGDMSQNQRERVMKLYREGQLDMLVATDVAARGIDVYDIQAVINFDIPQDDDSYIHRIGRTGRAEKSGEAYTLIYNEEQPRLKFLMRKYGVEIAPMEEMLQYATIQAPVKPPQSNSLHETRTQTRLPRTDEAKSREQRGRAAHSKTTQSRYPRQNKIQGEQHSEQDGTPLENTQHSHVPQGNTVQGDAMHSQNKTQAQSHRRRRYHHKRNKTNI